MEDYIKDIILKKKYFQLNSKEKKSIHDWASNEEEYDVLRSILLRTYSMASKNEAKLSSSVKQKLDERFATKYGQQGETLWKKFMIFFFPRETQFFKKPAFHLAMVAVVILLIIPFLWKDKPAQYAMNDSLEFLELESDSAEFVKEKEVQRNDSKIQESSDEKSLEITAISESAEPKSQNSLEDIQSVSPKNKDNLSIKSEQIRSKTEVYEPVQEEISVAEEVVRTEDEDMLSLAPPVKPKPLIKTSQTINLLMALY